MSDYNDSSDDEVKLPEDTLNILREFLAEKERKQYLAQKILKDSSNKSIDFEEDWQLSQFWYNEKTKSDLTNLCQQVYKDGDCIGLLSCPSLYTSIKNICKNVRIFEYDRRFRSFGDDFIFYDFNNAEQLEYLLEFTDTFDIIVADPPFLSEDCVRKMSVIIKKIMKKNAKILFCSGTIVEPWVSENLNLKKTEYKPEHSRKLRNDFILYTNFNVNSDLKN